MYFHIPNMYKYIYLTQRNMSLSLMEVKVVECGVFLVTGTFPTGFFPAVFSPLGLFPAGFFPASIFPAKKTQCGRQFWNAVEREPVETRVLNPTASEAS